MSGSAQDEWYYTRHGERLGPVAFSELQAKARELELNPRLDMVWKQGMTEWSPAGEVAGLFEKKSATDTQPAPTVKVATAAIAPPVGKVDPMPTVVLVADAMSKEGEWPGVGRRGFLFFTIVFPFVWALVFGFGGPFLEAQLGPEIMTYISAVAGVIPLIVSIFISVKRLVNLGMSGWWFFGNFVPLLNIWVGYRCFACPAGYAYHKKLDGIGVALAILYWLMLLVAILAIAAMVAFIVGAVHNPELEKLLGGFLGQLRDGMHKP